MKLIVGLGNPGEKYSRTRHNIGFMAVDEMAAGYKSGPWKKRFQGLASEGQIGVTKCLLLKPSTFMNESGRSVGEALRFYKLSAGDVIAIHDELDLQPGTVRVKTGGGNAGHNGLKSISAHIGNEYVRVRLGIGHPGDKAAVANYVLHDFSKAEEAWLQPLLEAIARGIPRLMEGSEAAFLSEAARGRLSAPFVPAYRNGESKAGPAAAVQIDAATRKSSTAELPAQAAPVQIFPMAAREGGGGGASSKPVMMERQAPVSVPDIEPVSAQPMLPVTHLEAIETAAPVLSPSLGTAPAADRSVDRPTPEFTGTSVHAMAAQATDSKKRPAGRLKSWFQSRIRGATL